jgi:hypothetical protein
MKQKSVFQSGAIALCTLSLWGSRVLSAQYTVVDISPAANGNSYYATGGSAAQQVGTLRQPPFGLNHALLLSGNGSNVVDLHPTSLPPDSPYFNVPGALVNTPSEAYAADGGAQIGCFINTAVMWSGTANSMLNLHPSPYGTSCAVAGSGGQQAGWATAQVSGGGRRGVQTSFSVRHAILWQGSSTSYIDLHPAGWGTNNNGQSQALLWFGSAASVINLHPQAFTSSIANAVNGLVVGTGTHTQSGKAITSINHALLWFGSASNYVDLHPAGFVNSYGVALNNNKQVGYGTVTDAKGTHNHALAWSGSAASVIDLNQFLPAGFTDANAVAIDLSGNIVGNASGPDGVQHQVIWMVP